MMSMVDEVQKLTMDVDEKYNGAYLTEALKEYHELIDEKIIKPRENQLNCSGEMPRIIQFNCSK